MSTFTRGIGQTGLTFHPIMAGENRSAEPVPRSSLLSIEAVVLIFSILTVLLYRILGLPLRDPFGLFWPRFANAVEWYALGLLAALLLLRFDDLRKAPSKSPAYYLTWERFAKRYLQSRRIVLNLRTLNAVSWLFVVFLNLKHLTPFINSAVYDAPLAKYERLVLDGRLAVEHLQILLGTRAAPILSAGYLFFFPYMALLILSFLFLPDDSTACKFFGGFALVWLLGVILIYPYPTWGPCFYFSDTVSHLPPTEVSSIQQALWRYKVYLDSHRADPGGVFIISGLPSLHFAITVLGSLALSRINRWLGRLSWLFALLTLLTTLYFGWHYLADDAAGLILALAVFYSTFGRRVCPHNA